MLPVILTSPWKLHSGHIHNALVFCSPKNIRHTSRVTGTTGSGATVSGGLDPLLDTKINHGPRGNSLSVYGAAILTSRLIGVTIELDRRGVAGLAPSVVVWHTVSQRGSLLPASEISVQYERISGCESYDVRYKPGSRPLITTYHTSPLPRGYWALISLGLLATPRTHAVLSPSLLQRATAPRIRGSSAVVHEVRQYSS